MPVKRRYMHPSSGLCIKADDTVFDLSKMLDNSSDPNNILYAMTYAHGAVHNDTIISASHYQTSGTSSILLLITTGTPLQAHLVYQVTLGGAGRIRLYEEPAIDAAGTSITISRLFRPSEKTTQVSITVGGTVTDGNYGTLLADRYNGGTNHAGSKMVHDDSEWVLKIDTAYALLIDRSDNAPASADLEWYEVPEL